MPFLAFFASPLFNKLLPFAAVLVAIVGIYFYGYSKGHHSAEAACNASAYKAQLVAEKLKEKNLQIQLTANEKTIADLTAEKQKVDVITKETIKTITKLVPENPACDVGPDVIKQINNLRGIK